MLIQIAPIVIARVKVSQSGESEYKSKILLERPLLQGAKYAIFRTHIEISLKRKIHNYTS